MMGMLSHALRCVEKFGGCLSTRLARTPGVNWIAETAEGGWYMDGHHWYAVWQSAYPQGPESHGY